ncbi:MAG: PAS domain-containing protein, partial [Candidatus Babeliales bacterium]
MVFKDSIYTVFFQHNPSPMYVYDATSLKILDVNNAALRQYGYTRDEFKNLHLKDIRSPEQRPALMQSVAVSPTHSGNAGIWKHQDKDGKEFFVEILVETCNHENRILKIVQAREISRGTEEKELRQAAQKETKYHLENTALGIIEWDKQFRVQHISSRITEISGYGINELINMHALDLAAMLVVESDLYHVRHSIEMLANGKATKNTFNLRFRRKDGKIASTKWYNSALRNQDNQLISVMSIVEDLTDQVRAERALTEEKERFRLLAENSSDVISRHHLDGTFIYVSPAIERLLGFRPEEIVGKWVYDFFHPDDIPDIKKIHHALLLSADDNKMTHRYKTSSGSYKWVETIGKAIRDPVTNEILEVHTSTRDISDRKKLEDKLITEKELLRTAIESMSGIFYMLDEQQRYILWNKNLEQSLGYSSEEIEQMHPLDFYREEDHEMIASKIEEVLDVGETNIEVDLFGKNGQYRRYYITGRVFENEGKKYVVGSGIDISERL